MAQSHHVPKEELTQDEYAANGEADNPGALERWLEAVGSTVDVVGFVNPADVQVTGDDMVTGIRPRNATLAGRDLEDPFDMPEERG